MQSTRRSIGSETVFFYTRVNEVITLEVGIIGRTLVRTREEGNKRKDLAEAEERASPQITNHKSTVKRENGGEKNSFKVSPDAQL